MTTSTNHITRPKAVAVQGFGRQSLKCQLVLIAPLLLAGCDSGPEWRNQQAQLANEANGIAPAAEPSSNVLADTDYINETAPAGNDVNAMAPDANQAEAPPEG